MDASLISNCTLSVSWTTTGVSTAVWLAHVHQQWMPHLYQTAFSQSHGRLPVCPQLCGWLMCISNGCLTYIKLHSLSLMDDYRCIHSCVVGSCASAMDASLISNCILSVSWTTTGVSTAVWLAHVHQQWMPHLYQTALSQSHGRLPVCPQLCGWLMCISNGCLTYIKLHSLSLMDDYRCIHSCVVGSCASAMDASLISNCTLSVSWTTTGVSTAVWLAHVHQQWMPHLYQTALSQSHGRLPVYPQLCGWLMCISNGCLTYIKLHSLSLMDDYRCIHSCVVGSCASAMDASLISNCTLSVSWTTTGVSTAVWLAHVHQQWMPHLYQTALSQSHGRLPVCPQLCGWLMCISNGCLTYIKLHSLSLMDDYRYVHSCVVGSCASAMDASLISNCTLSVSWTTTGVSTAVWLAHVHQQWMPHLYQTALSQSHGRLPVYPQLCGWLMCTSNGCLTYIKLHSLSLMDDYRCVHSCVTDSLFRILGWVSDSARCMLAWHAYRPSPLFTLFSWHGRRYLEEWSEKKSVKFLMWTC